MTAMRLGRAIVPISGLGSTSRTVAPIRRSARSAPPPLTGFRNRRSSRPGWRATVVQRKSYQRPLAVLADQGGTEVGAKPIVGILFVGGKDGFCALGW